MFQDDGASTEVTGMRVSSRARITAGKGSRTSPEKEKPGHFSETAGYEGSVESQTEDGVNDVICFFYCSGEIICEWNIEVFKLSRETLGSCQLWKQGDKRERERERLT